MTYRMATLEDIDLLVAMRLRFLEMDRKENRNVDVYNTIRDNCYTYFRKALADNTCDAVLAETVGECVGTGILFYYDSVPSAFNVTGKNAYITGMYVEPDYRGRGIGTAILNKVVETALKKEYKVIMLNASDMGKPMYEKMGFTKSVNGMILDRRTGK